MPLRSWPLALARVRLWSSMLAVTAILALSCSASSPTPPVGGPAGGQATDTPKSGGTLKVHHREDPPSLSILEEATNSTQFPVMNLYNNLVMFDPTKAPESLDTIVPELARKWTVAPDGKSITFELEKGVKWHDGTPFTSKDVKYTIETAKTSIDALRPDVKMRANSRASWWINVEAIETPDDLTAVFKLKRPQPSLMGMFAASYSPMYPSHVPVSDIRTKVQGTGPFKLVEWRKGETLIFTRNTDYWRPGRPYLEGVQYIIIGQQATAVAAIKTHQLQLSFPGEISKGNAADLKQAIPGLVVEEMVGTSRDNIPMNLTKAPWSDIRVRMAVAEALDRDAYVAVRTGEAVVGTNLSPSSPWAPPKEQLAQFPGYGPNMEERRAKARRLLAEAGFPNGFSTEVITRSIRVFTDLAPYTLDQLEKIGIKPTLKIMEQPIYVDAIYKGNFEIASNSSALGFDDPDVLFYENFKCNELRNYAHWCDPETERLGEQQSATLDPVQRKQLLQQMDRRLLEQAAWPVLGWRTQTQVWWPEVRGVKLMSSVQNAVRFDHVWLAQ